MRRLRTNNNADMLKLTVEFHFVYAYIVLVERCKPPAKPIQKQKFNPAVGWASLPTKIEHLINT